MALFGNPQDRFKAVHIAGTSGKTSTAYFIAALLTKAGKKVGLTISPHTEGINDRVQINLIPLPEVQFCKYFSEYMTVFEVSGLKATVFELMVGFAYWVFAKEKVDYAVVEVGLGGLLDGTNVMNQPDKVCVITDIGYDHTEVLGKALVEIVAQKAGIVHPNNTVFMYDQGDEIMDVVREVCEQQQAELHEVWPLEPKELPKSLPLFQRRNWYLALSTYNFLAERDGLKHESQKDLAATTLTRIPARMEILSRRGKTVILDGAHNAQKMQVLAESLRARFPHARFTVVFGLVRSRNFRLRTSVEAILGLGGHMILTSFDVNQEFRRVSVDPARVAEHCHLLGYDDWEVIADPHEAYHAAFERPGDIVLVTGSFYMIDQLRTSIFHKRHA